MQVNETLIRDVVAQVLADGARNGLKSALVYASRFGEGDDVARRGGAGAVPCHHGGVIAVGHEADVLAVGLVGSHQFGVYSQFPDRFFGIGTHRHQGAGQLLLVHTEEHV